MNKHDLIRLDEHDMRFVIDLRYATTDNFIGRVLYNDAAAIARRGTADKLRVAADLVGVHGCRLKIWDAYRPVTVHNVFWQALPDARYVANPATGGSKHSRGCAIDATLVNDNGDELEMPSSFDDTTIRGGRKYAATLPMHIQENLLILTSAMLSAGFDAIDSEWWHYCDRDWQEYTSAGCIV